MSVILPSLFGADILQLGDEIQLLESYDLPILHIDMMDGNFVSNIAFGPNQIKAVKNSTKMICDVHMMVQDPNKHLDDVIKTGADMISVHIESTPHIHLMLQKIRKAGRKAGVVLNPGTPLAMLEAILDDVDYVLLMSINPGTPGQSFISQTLKRIADLKEMIGERNIQIEVDGGVNEDLARRCRDAGADLIVVGGALFKEPVDENIRKLKLAGK